jgi:hypothetical protein
MYWLPKYFTKILLPSIDSGQSEEIDRIRFAKHPNLFKKGGGLRSIVHGIRESLIQDINAGSSMVSACGTDTECVR